ncbi:MAG: hypothetical protein HWQ43_21790 [Nostoc sp. JL31]|nr:hypothetical protein [Nostoc sp. JL31]
MIDNKGRGQEGFIPISAILNLGKLPQSAIAPYPSPSKILLISCVA